MGSNVENKVLLIRGKKTISLAAMISKKQEMNIFQITLLKPLLTRMIFTLWKRWKNIVMETGNWSF